MKLIQMPRGTGKSTAILRWLGADPARIAVVSSNAAHRYLLDRLDAEYGETPMAARQRVLVARPDLATTLQGRQGEVAVDDLDLVLASLLGRPVALGTLS